ncbi:MAG: Putative transposase [Eubacteriales bacterium]|jgi:putative transposase
MAFKTLMLQIYKPTKQKKDLMDAALLRYSRAFQFLMDRYRKELEELAESKSAVTQRLLFNLIDKETAQKLNDYDVQPFKDSLKIEFAAVSASYIAQKRKNPRVRYPFLFLDDTRFASEITDCIRQFDSARISPQNFAYRCSKLIGQKGNLRSLYFGRYAMNRNYCLLYDEFKDRFYAKLYLLNRKESLPAGNWASGLCLKYVWAGMPPLIPKPGSRSYIVVPLAFGKRQYADLKKALENPGLLHSARLVKREKKYYLMVNMECGQRDALTVVTTMGVARNMSGGLHYTVCREDGEIQENGSICAAPNGENLFRLANTIAGIAENNRSQVVVEANGGRNDRLPLLPGEGSCLSVGQYAALVKILKYKLPERGLPAPIEVSANGLFHTCPACGKRTRRNQVSAELFICIYCGYASESEWIGSESLAKRLEQYCHDKIPLTIRKTGDGLLCFNKILGFECLLPQGAADYTPVYDKLRQFLENMDGEYIGDPKKYAVWRKLFYAANLEAAVRFC